MNIGAPINDVTIPTGISDGDIIVLAIVSDTRRNIPPSNILPGIVYLWSAPSSNLAMFGIIKPTKEIIPATDTADAASTEDKTIENICNLFVFKPNVCDISVPNDNTLYSLQRNTEIIKPAEIKPDVDKNSVQPFPERPPLNQNIMCESDFPE